MAIEFSNGLSVDTSISNLVNIKSTAGSNIVSYGVNGTEQNDLPFACVYWNGGGTATGTYPQNNYPGGVGGQGFYPYQVPANEPYYWNSRYFNRKTSEFVCPVAGRYRMSVNILATGNQYNRNGLHVYAARNGSGVGVNGAHLVGSINYGTIHNIVVVACNAGDRLHWLSNDNGGSNTIGSNYTGFYRSYTGSWTTFTYCLLP